MATYRVQLNREFPFERLAAIAGYLRRLGIGEAYVSPIFRARPGSEHGYDGVDPTRINPELGGDEGFERLSEALGRQGLGLVVDIVPNHLATHPDNPTWMDLLEHGPAARHASWYDIDWHPSRTGRGAIDNAVLLPILGASYGETMERGEFRISFEDGSFFVQYYEHRFPLDPASYHLILGAARAAGPLPAELEALARISEEMPYRAENSEAQIEERYAQTRELKEGLYRLYGESRAARDAIDAGLAAIHGKPGDALSFTAMDRLLRDQCYRLVFWRTGLKEINYRRFFNINHLIALRMENESVFRETHEKILALVRQGKVTGLRIDHIDGLADPKDYLERLQAAGAFPVFVEKILSHGEDLPRDWPVDGTTGYDFTNAVNALFVHPKGFARLLKTYRKLTGRETDFGPLVHEQKLRVISELFANRVRMLHERLFRLARQDRYACDLPTGDLAAAFNQVSASLPIYRTYATDQGLSPADRSWIERAVGDAEPRLRDRDPRALQFVRRLLLQEFPAYLAEDERRAWRAFVRRWQQFTGPMVAKGHEDTALYLFNPLISLNEVGGDPGAPIEGVEAFHRFAAERARSWPRTLNATATHDTKRGEDTRARINALSEAPELWKRHLARWIRWNDGLKHRAAGGRWPDRNIEVLIYQSLFGIWPAARTSWKRPDPSLASRVKEYALKAAREAKAHTDWVRVDEEYERALGRFVDAILQPSRKNRFLEDFAGFQHRFALAGAVNSLSQSLLKMTAPGAPDFYQGTELWDFSLVDPDNRRPVDYALRDRWLAELEARLGIPGRVSGPIAARADLCWESAGGSASADRERLRLCRELLKSWPDGRIKLYLISTVLNHRRSSAALFERGEYLPLSTRRGIGNGTGEVVAFARRLENDWAVVLAPRLVTRALLKAGCYDARAIWKSLPLRLPKGAPRLWRDVLTGREFEISPEEPARIAEILRDFPGALLQSEVD